MLTLVQSSGCSEIQVNRPPLTNCSAWWDPTPRPGRRGCIHLRRELWLKILCASLDPAASVVPVKNTFTRLPNVRSCRTGSARRCP